MKLVIKSEELPYCFNELLFVVWRGFIDPGARNGNELDRQNLWFTLSPPSDEGETHRYTERNNLLPF